MVTLIHLRHDLPHSVLGLLFGVDRFITTRATAEIRALLAERGCAVPEHPGLRLETPMPTPKPKTSSYVWTPQIQVRRPQAGRSGRCAFVSGKKKEDMTKATVIVHWRGRTLRTDALLPERMHDAMAARNDHIAVCFQHFPDVEVLPDDGRWA